MRLLLFCLGLLIVFLMPISIDAYCGPGMRTSERAQLNNLAANVKFTIFHEEKNDKMFFSVRINNMHPKLSIYDVLNERYIEYGHNREDPFEFVLRGYKPNQSLRFQIFSKNTECLTDDILLFTSRVQIPGYNEHYDDPLCEGYGDVLYCRRWQSLDLSKEEFVKRMMEIKHEEAVEEEKTNNEGESIVSLFEIVKKYYLYIIVAFLIIFVIKLVNKRRDTFKL